MGVFDGHGGAACAQIVAKRLFDYICVGLLPKDLLEQYLSSLENSSITFRSFMYFVFQVVNYL